MKHGIDIIKVAKELINDQLLELRKLSDNLEQDFVDVIEALSNCQGSGAASCQQRKDTETCSRTNFKICFH